MYIIFLQRITKQYVRKHPKRKRLPSVESIESDNESDKELPVKKKPKEIKRTKEEVRLISFTFINSCINIIIFRKQKLKD